MQLRLLGKGEGGRRRERGQSLAEFALVAPIFFLLVFGIIDFGLGLRTYISVSAATREGARYAAVGAPAGTFSSGGAGDCNGTSDSTAVGRVCRTLGGLRLSNLEEVSVTYPNGANPGKTVRVSAAYEYNFITPVDGMVKLMTGGKLGTFTLRSATEMRLE